MMQQRSIPQETYKSEEWFAEVETAQDDWVIAWGEKPSKNGCPAHLKANPKQQAWVKPRRDEPDVAAKEKIGADLAYLLGLPVSSILLCKAATPGKAIRPAAISKYSFSQNHLKWSRLKNKREEGNVIAAADQYFRDNLEATAAMWVFDTWIRNRDRSDRNIMVGYSNGQLDDVYFFDFDISMSWRGNLQSGNWTDVFAVPTSEHITNHVKLQHAMPAIEQIESLPEKDILAIVDRIPDFYLPADRKELSKKALLHRRKQLRSVFESALSKKG